LGFTGSSTVVEVEGTPASRLRVLSSSEEVGEGGKSAEAAVAIGVTVSLDGNGFPVDPEYSAKASWSKSTNTTMLLMPSEEDESAHQIR
jgi:hypothetical protein